VLVFVDHGLDWKKKLVILRNFHSIELQPIIETHLPPSFEQLTPHLFHQWSLLKLLVQKMVLMIWIESAATSIDLLGFLREPVKLGQL
jgi:hypothetical protein